MKAQAKTVSKMHNEIMTGLQSLKDAKKQGLVKSDKVDFRQMQSLYLRGVGMSHAPRQERLHRLKVVTHTKKGGKSENFTSIQAFYDDGHVLAKSGDVYKAVKVGNTYIAHVEYVKTPDGTLCLDCR